MSIDDNESRHSHQEHAITSAELRTSNQPLSTTDSLAHRQLLRGGRRTQAKDRAEQKDDNAHDAHGYSSVWVTQGCIVAGWPTKRETRKSFAFSEDGINRMDRQRGGSNREALKAQVLCYQRGRSFQYRQPV